MSEEEFQREKERLEAIIASASLFMDRQQADRIWFAEYDLARLLERGFDQ